MLKDVIQKWDEHKSLLKDYFSNNQIKCYSSYTRIVEQIAELILEWKDAIVDEVKHEEYEGNAVYVIWKRHYMLNEEGEQRNYLVTFNHYGSCSGCDTLYGIIGSYPEEIWKEFPTDEQVRELMTLSLHLIQRMHRFEYDLELEKQEFTD